MDGVWVADTTKQFSLQWSMILWVITLILGILLATPFWKYVWHLSLTLTAFAWVSIIGLFVTMTMGYVNMGPWFGWTPFLTSMVFVRWLVNQFFMPEESSKRKVI